MVTPAPGLSPDLLKRLTYSKYLLTQATRLQRDGNELATAQAVLVAHDAAEMLMRVVVDHVGAYPNPRWDFPQFWQIVAEKTGDMPPLRGDMDRLNDLRKGFKHKGNLPNPNVAATLLPVLTAFCREIASLYLKLDFEAVSMADLIPNEEARAKVKEAEDSFAKGEVKNAVLALSIAQHKLHKQATEKFGFMHVKTHNAGPLRDLAYGLAEIVRRVNLLSLGINPIRAAQFGQRTPGLSISPFTESMQVQWWTEPTAEDYEFCHEFVIDFGLRLAAE